MKKHQDGKTILNVTANKDISLIEILPMQKEEPIRMVRTNLKRNEKVEFSYPVSSAKIRIEVYFGKEKKTYEV